MSDGAIRADVIAVLREKRVDVTEVGNGRVRLAFGSNFVEVIKLNAVVGRSRLHRFEWMFGIPVAAFYPAVSETPQDRAAGE